MRYFVTDSERKNTVYHEFQKGHWDGKTFWKPDSISLGDDWFFRLDVEGLLAETVPGYDPYDITVVTPALWENVKAVAVQKGGMLCECILEADTWAAEAFRECGVFSIIDL